MEKVVVDGMTKVLISEGYGSGFYTYGAPPNAVFDPKLIELVESGNYDATISYVEKTYPGIYLGGVSGLTVCLIPVDTEFTINEYYGYESITYKQDINWMIS